jgi:hypothetical protein
LADSALGSCTASRKKEVERFFNISADAAVESQWVTQRQIPLCMAWHMNACGLAEAITESEGRWVQPKHMRVSVREGDVQRLLFLQDETVPRPKRTDVEGDERRMATAKRRSGGPRAAVAAGSGLHMLGRRDG